MAETATALPPLPPRTRYVVVAEELVTQLSAHWSEPVRVKIVEDDGQVLKLVVQREYSPLHG